MSDAALSTLVKILSMPHAKTEPEKKRSATVLRSSYLSKMLYPTTDIAVGSYSDPQETSTKAPLLVGDIIRENLDIKDLLSLRLVNKAVKSWVEGDDFDFSTLAFNTLHLSRRLHNRFDEHLSLIALQNIASFCTHFYIHLDDMLNPVLPLVHRGVSLFDENKSSLWMQLFHILGSLETLSISAPGQPDWHKFGTGEAILESIRAALEAVLPAGLRDITLSPINATGLLHFRWRGAAFKQSTWMAEAFWGHITNLSIGLLNPLPHYSQSNQKDFIKALHDHLGSFSRSLKEFRFSWIGPTGPNPLLLDLRYGGHNFSSPAIKWSTLTMVHLKNVFAHCEDVGVLWSTRCPNLELLKLEEIQMMENVETVVWEEDDEGDDGLEHAVSEQDTPLPCQFPLG
ncbi:hypothetical protein UCDDS831_g00319 [Diplodia seriata]|uniref:Uncharacterized protein n=1 Tax=Diplodia seriata TaxID=420778 RepID=A0A0G2F221_9PEZI|nr:hypothetical protein UCDDS831_g00319 [Diplodia seriata]